MKKSIVICTDGAANTTGHRLGIVATVENLNHPDILSTHCIIHRELLVAKKCPQNNMTDYQLLLK